MISITQYLLLSIATSLAAIGCFLLGLDTAGVLLRLSSLGWFVAALAKGVEGQAS